MGKRRIIGDETRDIIFQVYLYFASEATKFRGSDNGQYFNKVQARVAKATGVSCKTLLNLLKSQDMVRFQTTLQKTEQSKKGKQDAAKSDSDEESDTNELSTGKPGPSKRARYTNCKGAIIHTVSKSKPPPLVPLPTKYEKSNPDVNAAAILPRGCNPVLIKAEIISDSDDAD